MKKIHHDTTGFISSTQRQFNSRRRKLWPITWHDGVGNGNTITILIGTEKKPAKFLHSFINKMLSKLWISTLIKRVYSILIGTVMLKGFVVSRWEKQQRAGGGKRIKNCILLKITVFKRICALMEPYPVANVCWVSVQWSKINSSFGNSLVA